MSEGDVSLIQDEDVLRRMWQQTEDMTKRKEIRAHMYKLREERLKTLYAEPTQAESKGFTTSGGHTDSFADQCFQSIKSKEVRDSESPTRDYHYKVEGADNSNGGWTVVNKNEVSDDGRTKTQSSVAHTSGTREVDGGNATFAALNENEKTVSQFEDDNNKQFSTGESSKTVAREQFVSDTGDGKITSSTTSSVGTSHKHSSSSHKYESNVDDDDRDVPDFSTALIDDNINKKSFKTSSQDSKNIQNTSSSRVVSSKVTSSVVDDSVLQGGDGELVSRKVEHPDEFTKVTTETRRLPDGSMVTSTSRETRGSYSSKSGKQTSDRYDSSTASRSSTSEQHVNKQLKSHIDNESKVISTDKYSEKKHTSYIDDDAVPINKIDRSVQDDVNSEDLTSTVRRVESVKVNKSNNHNDDVNIVRDVSNVKSREEYETHYKTPKNDVESIVDEGKVIEHIPVYKSHIETVTSEDVRPSKVEYHEIEEPYQSKKTAYVLDNDCPKQDAFASTNSITDKGQTGDYVTTYQNDYTSKKISEDLSPTHNAWASSLRSSPDSPLQITTPRGTPSVRSFRTSTSSLRSSISPDKKCREYPGKNSDRSPSPKKVSSPTRISSERDISVKKTTREDKSQTPTPNSNNKRDYSPEKNTKTPERNAPRDQSPGKTFTNQKNRPVREPSNEDFNKKYHSPSTSPSRRSPTKKSTQEQVSLYSTTKSSSPYSSDTSPNRSPVRNVHLKKTPDHKSERPKQPSPARSPTRSYTPGSPSVQDTYIYKRSSVSPSPSPTRLINKTNKYVSPSTSPVRNPAKSSNVTTPRGSPSISPTRNSSPRKQSIGSQSPTRKIKDSIPNNNIRAQPKSERRSRDSSPTTSVSEIEFITRVKKMESSVDSSDDENDLNIKREVIDRKKSQTSEKVDTSTIVRKSSLKKTSVTGIDTVTKYDDVTVVQNTLLDDEDDRSFENHRIVKKDKPEEPTKENKTKVKSPYTRSETYEERCRKILGMPDKKTLVEGAERNLSEILGNLSVEKPFENIETVDDVDRSTPNRELTTGVKSAEVTSDSDSTLRRKSSLRKKTDEQVRNLVDAEYIKLDTHGNVVSADSKEVSNKENDYKLNRHIDNKIKTEKLIQGERTQEQRNRKSSPTKSFLETEKRDIENTRKKQSEIHDITNKDEKVTKEFNSRQTDGTKDRKLSNTIKTDDKIVTTTHTKTSTTTNKLVREAGVAKTKPRSPSPKKEPIKSYQQNRSPERKPKTQDIDDKVTPRRSSSPQKNDSRCSSPLKNDSRSSSPQKNDSRSSSPYKNDRRSSSPQKNDSRSSSPQKVKTSTDIVTTHVTKTSKTTKDQSESVVSDKKTNIVDKKQAVTKVNKPTSNVSVAKKPEPTRTILTSQKYNIFKDDKLSSNKKNECMTKKKETSTNVNTKTAINRNVSEKISNVQSTVLSKFEKDKNKINTDTVEASHKKRIPEFHKKPSEEQKSPKMHRSSIDALKTSTKTSNVATEMKITRTASDIGMKTTKPQPTRMRSKPEINITKTTTVKNVNQTKNTTVTNKSNITTSQLTSKTTTKSSLKSKLTRGIDDSDVIIDIQHAKSSRENSPDHICPLPVSSDDDRNKPRYPDNVMEPDDYTKNKKRVHDTISESDAVTQSRIIELSDSEEEMTNTKFDNKTKVDKFNSSVTEKVSKFSNTKDSKKTDTRSSDMKKHKKIITDEVEGELRSDDCLLSVSDKVTKFINASDTHKSTVHHQKVISNDFLKHEISDSLVNDECLLSVNDKVSRFLNAAEKVTEPIKITQPTPKPLRPDVYVVDKGTKNVSDKPNKHNSAPVDRLGSSEKSPGLVSKASKMINDVKSKFEHVESAAADIQLTVQKETIASQAKKTTAENKHVHLRSQTSPDRLSPERTSPRPSLTPEKTPEKKPVSILKNSDNVKKAKALFENIANQKPETLPWEPSHGRATKLTDIGVFKKSPTAESVPDTAVPKKDLDDSSVCTESDSEPDKIENRRRSIEIAQNIYNKAHRLSSEREITEVTTKSSKKSNVKQTHTYDNEVEHQNKTTNVNKKTEVTGEDFISTRRGSGKFGVELRRTNTEQSFNSERKHSGVVDSQSQPTIEDINDLSLLEQMLEKVSGYEQRRRIRSQIRIVKKNLENSGKSHLYETVRSRNTTHMSKKTTDKDDVSHTNNIEHRKVSPVSCKDTREISPTRKTPRQTTTTTTVETKTRSTSPDKKVKTQSPDRKRSTSPTKKTTETIIETIGSKATSKKSHSQSEKIEINSETDNIHHERVTSPSRSRTSKVSEYTTAYLRKIGASNNLKSEYLPKVPNISRKDREEIVNHTTSYTTRRVSNTSEKNVSTQIIDTETEYITRSPSPKRSPTPNERIYVRTPSPDLKKPRQQQDAKSKTTEYQSAFSNFKTKSSSKDLFSKTTTKQRVAEEKPEWATNNILRKTTNDTKVYSTKKSDDKTKTTKRSQSPSKAIRKPTDVITSSYGVGPTDENGKPLFGIKALRKHSNTHQNYEVKGTVVTKEFHSVNGGPPEGHITVTAYSSDPTDLTNVIDRVESQGKKVSSDVKRSLHEKQNSRSKGVSSITSTTRYGGSTGNQVSRIHKSNQPKAIEAPRGQPPAGRRGSVKCLTEKFIKNAVETSKTEKSTYPKAGLILRTSSFRDNASGSVSSRSSTPGVVRTDSNTSVNSTEMSTSRVEHHHQQSESHMSFLDSKTKVSGVQDIITRMKNADIVIQDGDTMEDAEARALLNKFLGATVLMHGMSGYTEDKTPTKECKRETRTVVTKTSTVVSDIDDIWDERVLRKLLEESDDYEERRRLRARLRQVMAEQEACAQIVADAAESAGRLRDFPDADSNSSREQLEQIQLQHDENVSTIETTKMQKISTVSSKVSEETTKAAKPVSPFAKFRQLDRQNSSPSSPNSPKTPLTPTGGSAPLFKFTDPQLQASASNIKERLLQWCRDKTQDYENVKLDNFSTSWSDGLAFCALIHHFLPDEYDFTKLTAQQRRYNFTLAFKVADEKAGIYPLLDVEDMVTMRKPDWKCVFTYVQAIHRRFKDQD